MHTSPSSPQEPEAVTQEERRRRDLLAMSTTEIELAPGWGERLLPYLFIATESCWVVVLLSALASTFFFQSHTPLLPLWAPFVLMASAHWCAAYLERRDLPNALTHDSLRDRSAMTGGAWRIYVLFVALLLFILWASVYASRIPLWNPLWLGALLSDLFSLNGTAFQIVVTIALVYYFCWRGVRLSRRVIEPAMVFGTLRLGVGVLLVAILLEASPRAAQDTFASISLLLLLIPLFLSLALLTHALARATFLRRGHPVGLQGSVAQQERALLGVIASVSVAFVLLAVLIGTLASPAFLAQMQRALAPLGHLYDLLTTLVAYVLLLLVTPLFWLFSLVHPVSRPAQSAPIQLGAINGKYITVTPLTPLLIIVPILKLAFPLLIAALLIVLIRLVLRRRRLVLVRRTEDTHESMWSWALFWAQLKALALALWRHLFPHRRSAVAAALLPEEVSGEPGARSVREVYRALLAWAAKRGYPRKKSETPHEFNTRLIAHVMFAEPEISTLTEVYTATRYGGLVPDEAEVARVQGAWQALQQKANTTDETIGRQR
jgi:hypothetical protein